MHFDNFPLTKELLNNLDKLGFTKTTDIQYKAIPPILNGEDLLAIAQTGTGKSAAFAIPVIQKIHNFKTSRKTYGVKAIVLAPTRELSPIASASDRDSLSSSASESESAFVPLLL